LILEFTLSQCRRGAGRLRRLFHEDAEQVGVHRHVNRETTVGDGIDAIGLREMAGMVSEAAKGR